MQSAFLFPEARISVVLAQYATLDIDSPFYNPPPLSPPSGHSIVSDYLAKLKPSSIRVSSPMPDRWDLCEAILAEGRHREFIGNEDKVRLMSTLKQAHNPPAIWLAQGTNDPIVSTTKPRKGRIVVTTNSSIDADGDCRKLCGTDEENPSKHAVPLLCSAWLTWV